MQFTQIVVNLKQSQKATWGVFFGTREERQGATEGVSSDEGVFLSPAEADSTAS